MLTFEEFQKKAAQTADKRLYLSLEQQKECYKWYVEGCKQGWEDCNINSEWRRNNAVTDDGGWYRIKSEEFLKEIENAETEEN